MADKFDHLGYAQTDIGSEVSVGTSVPVATFTAYRKSDGSPVVVDDRTFDGATMQLTPPPPAQA